MLSQHGDRWLHVVAVAARSRALAHTVPAGDRALLESAAWLHDIGYGLVDTGHHALDGARHLRAAGASARLCRLVAHHTGALVEARTRHLGEQLLAEFVVEHSVVADALTYADLTTGPRGQPMTVQERLEDILQRYPASHMVHQSVLRAAPALRLTAGRMERRLS